MDLFGVRRNSLASLGLATLHVQVSRPVEDKRKTTYIPSPSLVIHTRRKHPDDSWTVLQQEHKWGKVTKAAVQRWI